MKGEDIVQYVERSKGLIMPSAATGTIVPTMNLLSDLTHHCETCSERVTACMVIWQHGNTVRFIENKLNDDSSLN